MIWGGWEGNGQSLIKVMKASGDARVFSCSKPFSIRRKDPGVFFAFSPVLEEGLGFMCASYGSLDLQRLVPAAP